MSSKMDRQGPRTPADLEWRYNLGKTFAEVMGIATDARRLAEEATTQSITVDRLDIDGQQLNVKVDATNITGEVTAEQINAEGLQVKNGSFSGDLFAQNILLQNKTISVVSDDGGTTTRVPISWHLERTPLSPDDTSPNYYAYATIDAPVTVDITGLKYGIWYKTLSFYDYGSGEATIVAGETRSSTITYWSMTSAYLTSRYVCTEYADVAESGMVVAISSSVAPSENDHFSLGTANRRWADIYSMTGTINTSDEREKNSISEIPQKYSDMFYKLNPIIYKFNNGTSDRLHVGFSAQEVERAMSESGIDSKEFAGLIKSPKADGDFIYGLRYDEFIALAVLQIQKLSERVAELERQMNDN